MLGSNNSNFTKGAPGEPVLISWDDAETYFHEFGHALHYLSSNVDYPTLNGGGQGLYRISVPAPGKLAQHRRGDQHLPGAL